MQLYLIRHAHAVDTEEDPERPLSKRGAEQVTGLAGFLRRSDLFRPEEFWHSPLVRSRETVEVLARRMRLDVPHTKPSLIPWRSSVTSPTSASWPPFWW
jgi:phosphohistidine phosphatase SixA